MKNFFYNHLPVILLGAILGAIGAAFVPEKVSHMPECQKHFTEDQCKYLAWRFGR